METQTPKKHLLESSRQVSVRLGFSQNKFMEQSQEKQAGAGSSELF